MTDRKCWRVGWRLGVAAGVVASAMAFTGGPVAAERNEGATTTAATAGSRLSVGARHACAIRGEGAVWCWGSNEVGQLGDGTVVTSQPTPVQVAGITGATSVAAGGLFTCASLADGTVKCWGSQRFGRLGNGLSTNVNVPTPVGVVGITNAVAVSAGENHTCALLAGGTVSCWGRDGYGAFPDGSSLDSSTPVAIAGITDATMVSAGGEHTCVVRVDETAWCWGDNTQGQLGDGTQVLRTAPVQVVGLAGVKAISAGVMTYDNGSTCAVLADATARCWGGNGLLGGNLGTGNDSASYVSLTPVSPTGLTGVASISVNAYSTCAGLLDGGARCWGGNNGGQLGIGTVSSREATPQVVLGVGAAPVLTGVAVVATGGAACALHSDDIVTCWGSNDRGQLGQGSTSQSSSRPVQVALSAGSSGPSGVATPTNVALAVGDATNATIELALSDPDTNLDDLTIVAETASPAIIPNSGVTFTGSGATRTVHLAPVGAGNATVGLRVSDPEGNFAVVTVTATVTAQIPDPSGRYYTGILDASAALDVGDGHVLVANDETNVIGLYRAATTGGPIKTWSYDNQQLGTGAEVDIESVARSGDVVVWSGSHGNNRGGTVRTERRTLFATTISGSGAATELAFRGRYNGLWSELIAWDQNNGHGLGANALDFVNATQPGVLPNAPDGFNIEGMEFAVDGSLYLGFRAPTVNVAGEERALLVPVLNALDLVAATPGTGPAQFGAPVMLDLDGRSIRDIRRNAAGQYLIIGGTSEVATTWGLYTWNGDPATAPVFDQTLPDADTSTTGVWEAIVSVPESFTVGSRVRLATDSGDSSIGSKAYSQEFMLHADGPDPVVPEAPFVIAISLSAVLIGGVLVRRQRAAWTTA